MKRALIGSGGSANEIRGHMLDYNMLCFVDDEYYNEKDKNVLPLSKFDPYEYEILISIGDSYIRKKIVEKLPSETKYFTYIHPSVIILDSGFEIGEGSLICANSIITTNCKIGKHSQLNLSTTISHDCIIGDFFTTAPNVSIAGNCNIGDFVYFGTNSCCKQKIKICSNVNIGLMSGVVKNIDISGTYIGTPCKLIK
jgi:sugar O-acyltransferase (sialic acid O-acetyltransferase NeuD family)